MPLVRRGPARAWWAVLALAILASLSVSVVVDAGLSAWRGTPAQRAIAVLPDRALRPAPAVVTVAPRHPHASAPVASPPAAHQPQPATVQRTAHVTAPAARVQRPAQSSATSLVSHSPLRSNMPLPAVKTLRPAVEHLLIRTPPLVVATGPARALVDRVVNADPPAPQIQGWGVAMEAFQQS